LYPKCTKTRLCASVISKISYISPGLYPGPRYKREGNGTGHGKGRRGEENGREGKRRGEGRKRKRMGIREVRYGKFRPVLFRKIGAYGYYVQ
jgi:hypothetical protein